MEGFFMCEGPPAKYAGADTVYPGQPASKRKYLTLSDAGKFVYDGEGCKFEPSVRIWGNYVDIGCTTLTRDAVEKLMELFATHFPMLTGVKIQ